ncbi:hypothetical protein OR16_02285 [Cupriavidus basilensis OR16]|uniref:Bacterial Ig domain-containing protein n=1 Tax=Cupriavidus basilensis OR16 TaxID=1127483 RepID=H1RYV3_9BURK|nr:hypothetical protein [Cupriavidus basilensis]EHP44484.1 hypothetical protein OR16_02285 [Cupriavidus basilensis OR16]
MHRRILLTPAVAAITLAVLSACGGGGDGSTAATPASQAAKSTLQGTAASGAFMANALVTVYDADGKVVGSNAADSNGHFEFDVSAFRAPFAVVATGSSGGDQLTYVSVLATKPANGSATVNVTPLTTAVAALLVGGNPLDLTKASVLGSKASSAQVQQIVGLLRSVLANVTSDAGLDPTAFDPISTPLSKQGEGADSVLDVIRVTLTTSGAKLTSTGAVITDNNAAHEVLLTPDSLASPPSALPKPEVKTNAATFEGIRAALQACFALDPAARADGASVLGACSTAFSSDYLNNSYTARDDLFALLAASDMKGARFEAPVVLFNSTNTQNQATALVRLPFVRTDKSTDHLTRVVTNRAPGGWQLTGNQRKYEAAVTRRISKVTELNPQSAQGIVSRYESSLRLLLNPARGLGVNVQLVRVTGPGLPNAGVILSRSRVCGSFNNLVIQNLAGSLTYATDDPVLPNQTINNSGQSSSTVVLAATAIDSSQAVKWSELSSGGNTYLSAALSDSAIESLPAHGRYKFEVWNRNVDTSYKTSLAAADDTFYVTSSGSVLTPSVLARQTWNSIDAGSLDFVTTGGSKTAAQSGTRISWTQNAETVDRALAFGSLQSAVPLPERVLIQGLPVARSARSDTVSATNSGSSALTPCSTAVFPAFGLAGDQRTVEIRSTTADDTQKFVRIVGTVR